MTTIDIIKILKLIFQRYTPIFSTFNVITIIKHIRISASRPSETEFLLMSYSAMMSFQFRLLKLLTYYRDYFILLSDKPKAELDVFVKKHRRVLGYGV